MFGARAGLRYLHSQIRRDCRQDLLWPGGARRPPNLLGALSLTWLPSHGGGVRSRVPRGVGLVSTSVDNGRGGCLSLSQTRQPVAHVKYKLCRSRLKGLPFIWLIP